MRTTLAVAALRTARVGPAAGGLEMRRAVICRWRAIFALVLALVALAVVLSAVSPMPLHGMVVLVPLGRGGELDVHLWGPSPDIRVVVWRQTAVTNHRLAAFTLPALPLFCVTLGLAVGLVAWQWRHTGVRTRNRK
ncbi:MAG TPA: hypothetical protein VEZ12_10645 [Herpetosiphonaceae bacterium]|nr:hypothetical protein [Herpetosiphonaceae bacterium]